MKTTKIETCFSLSDHHSYLPLQEGTAVRTAGDSCRSGEYESNNGRFMINIASSPAVIGPFALFVFNLVSPVYNKIGMTTHATAETPHGLPRRDIDRGKNWKIKPISFSVNELSIKIICRKYD